MSISTGSNPFRQRPPRKRIPRGMTAEEMEPISTAQEREKPTLPKGSKDISATDRRPSPPRSSSSTSSQAASKSQPSPSVKSEGSEQEEPHKRRGQE